MLSLRYLRARRKEGFISVIAGFSFLGIMLGVATLIIVMAVMNGFRKELLDKILGLNGHLLVQPLESPLTDWEQVAAAALAGARASGWRRPIVEGQALASSPFNATGVLVRGIRAADLVSSRSIANNIKQGTLEGFDEGQGVVIGRRLADQLSLRAGDNVTLVAPRGAVTPMGTTPRIKAYKVAAVFEIGMSEYDAAFVFMPLTEAQAYFNRSGDVTAIEVYTDNPDRMDRFRKLVTEAAGRPIFMVDWRQRNATFFNALQVERNVMFLILTLIVLVAALNIISGLIMLVKDKGARHRHPAHHGRDARRGHARLPDHRRRDRRGRHAGRLRWSACLVCLNIESIRQFLSWLTSTELFSPELYFLSRLPAEHGCRRDHGGGGHGAGAVAAGDALSGLARRAARSGRSAAVRVIRRWPRRARRRSSSCTASSGIITQGDATLDILKGAELAVWPGQSVALIAPSGAGKSTLLHIAGLLEHPDAGEVYLDGVADRALSDAERTRFRRTDIGFVYQFHHLLPEFSAIENVMMPQMIRGLGARARRATARRELLSYLGLRERLDAPAGGALRRRAAARRDRARGRQCAAHPAGRRADRQSRSAHRRPCVRRAGAARARFRPGGHRRDPQYGHRRAHGPARHHPRRAGGGAEVGCIEVRLSRVCAWTPGTAARRRDDRRGWDSTCLRLPTRSPCIGRRC